MTVEALDQMMTYVIEGWMIFGGAYLTLGFATSFIRLIREDIAAERAAQAEGLTEAEQAAQTDRAEDRERLAEVVAVSEKYTKPAVSESVPTS
ncbi:MAG: hypothetical protein F6J97_20990, partial [Leptolyngbya sp. SIO4C1]|nr:hypothetical protein [Leptolyngbya sp. SIO4C1]